MNEFLKLPADKRRVIYEQVSLRMGINDAKVSSATSIHVLCALIQ